MKSIYIKILLLFSVIYGPNLDSFGNRNIKKSPIDIEVELISEKIFNLCPPQANILVNDIEDLNNLITYFGKHLSEKISIELTKYKELNIVNRNSLRVIMNEQKLTISGLLDPKQSTKIGKVVGAEYIVYGTFTELQSEIEIRIKLISIAKSQVINGFIHKIKKSPKIIFLISKITKSEKQLLKELELLRKKMEKDIENQRLSRLQALKDEERDLKNKLKKLENEIRKNSKIINLYKKKLKEAEKQRSYIEKIHTQIDNLNMEIPEKLKVGMSKKQINKIFYKLVKEREWGNSLLGDKGKYVWRRKPKMKVASSLYTDVFILGSYYLIFNGEILVKGCKIGSDTGYSIIDSPSAAAANGVNQIKK